MILTSHIIVSGLLGATTNNYFLAAVFGFASHYILDAIPHWDSYISPEFKIRAEAEDGGFVKKKLFWKEISKITIDILIGLSLLFVIFIALKNPLPQNIIPILISIFFGVLPDALQLLYWMTKWQCLKWNFDLHHFVHFLNLRMRRN